MVGVFTNEAGWGLQCDHSRMKEWFWPKYYSLFVLISPALYIISKFWLCKHQWRGGLEIAHISWAVQVQEVLFLFCLSKNQFWYLLILLVCFCGGISFLCFTCSKCFPLELCGNMTSIICHWLIVDQNATFFVSANPTWTRIPSEVSQNA